MTPSRFTVFLFLAALLVQSDARGDELYDELVVCRDLPSDEARLICYDAAVDRSRSRGGPKPVAPTPAPAATAVAAPAAAAGGEISQEELFGMTNQEIERTIEEASGSTRIESLSSEVARLQQTGTGKVVITLENGQVWRQVDSSNLRLRVGDEIRIERAALGSYLLQKTGSKRSMRVNRYD